MCTCLQTTAAEIVRTSKKNSWTVNGTDYAHQFQPE